MSRAWKVALLLALVLLFGMVVSLAWSAPQKADEPKMAVFSVKDHKLIEDYYNHLAVAIVRLESGRLHVGDVVHIRGHTSDFTQRVESLEVNHASTTEVGPNDDFGLKVAEHVREHDVVYKVLRP